MVGRLMWEANIVARVVALQAHDMEFRIKSRAGGSDGCYETKGMGMQGWSRGKVSLKSGDQA